MLRLTQGLQGAHRGTGGVDISQAPQLTKINHPRGPLPYMGPVELSMVKCSNFGSSLLICLASPKHLCSFAPPITMAATVNWKTVEEEREWMTMEQIRDKYKIDGLFLETVLKYAPKKTCEETQTTLYQVTTSRTTSSTVWNATGF